MMELSISSVIYLLAAAPLTTAFAPTSSFLQKHLSTSSRHSPRILVQSSSDAIDANAYSGECLLTPEGYGFSTPAKRVLSSSNGEKSFYVANANDRIIDVMSGITEGDQDVALVYDGSDLLGIFTETDYIEVR